MPTQVIPKYLRMNKVICPYSSSTFYIPTSIECKQLIACKGSRLHCRRIVDNDASGADRTRDVTVVET
eukprot:1144185-Pelagomonas_calceolata.AAC.1